MTLSLVKFPEQHAVQNIPEALRSLADGIESGEYGDAYNVVWAIDCGDGRLEVGLMGAAPQPALTAYYMAGLTMRKIEGVLK